MSKYRTFELALKVKVEHALDYDHAIATVVTRIEGRNGIGSNSAIATVVIVNTTEVER